ncbi:MAG: hypothetical protein QOE82_3324, partial [Thermoanaerobaculia bacterium]|nr:hypothetical protein [Thermoanaerobaculia bacterium]
MANLINHRDRVRGVLSCFLGADHRSTLPHIEQRATTAPVACSCPSKMLNGAASGDARKKPAMLACVRPAAACGSDHARKSNRFLVAEGRTATYIVERATNRRSQRSKPSRLDAVSIRGSRRDELESVMAWKDIIGARFSPAEFDDYVRQLVFTTWRPQFVVVHNTGSPTLAERPVGFTPAHIQNLVTYYRDGLGWSAGPHCFVDQNGIWVFTPLTTPGVHSPSWNDKTWGVETLGEYEAEAFTDPIHENLVACLATLHSLIPLDVNNLRFHKEDPITDHTTCPGKNIDKIILIQDVHTLIAARQTLAAPSSGRLSGRSPAAVVPQSHFFADHGSLTQGSGYGPKSTDEYRVTGLVKAPADVNAYAAVNGMVMIQRVADKTNPGTYLGNVVNLVLKPFKQPIKGFTRVKYFIYRNVRLDSFLKGASATDEALVRNKAGGSQFIQNLWVIHTAQNGAAPFKSTVLGFDPPNQPGTAAIDKWFHRQNASEQLPFAASGEQIGKFYANSGNDSFGIEIILEGPFEPDYENVRTSTETIIAVPATAAGTDSQLQRARILNYIDPAAFYGMHMAPGGSLEVQDGSTKKKLKGVAVYDNVVTKFATANTLYTDIRNENGLALDFYGAYLDGTGNALEVGPNPTSLTAQPYASDKWPLIIRKSVAEANANAFNLVVLRLRRAYNKKPILYLLHGEADRKTTKGRFIADTDLIAAAAANTNAITLRYPNKDLGSGQRIGVAWMIRADYALRQDPANIPFSPKVVPTATYRDNLFGPIDADLPWTVNNPVIAWATSEDKKYVDGDGVAALGFEHMADRGVAFSQWTGAASTAGTVLFYATAKDSFVNKTKLFTPQNGTASGVSNRDTFFAEPMLFEGLAAGYDSITDGPTVVQTMVLRAGLPNPRPPEAMLLLGLTRGEVDTQLVPLTGLDPRYPRNVLLEEVAGSPFTDSRGKTYRKYKAGLRGIKINGDAERVFPSTDVIVYTID